MSSCYNGPKAALIELRDLADEISTEQDHVEIDDTRAETIRERLNLIYQLQSKHQLKDVAALIALRNDLGQKVSKVLNLDDALPMLKLKQTLLVSNFRLSADALSASDRQF
jgi:DNA repair protein RecN (Recombination protein N)